MTQSRKCFKCLSDVKNVWDDQDYPYQPDSGVEMTTHGNYGSTVFDPMNNRESLSIIVCDKCLTEQAEVSPGVVQRVIITAQTPLRESEDWHFNN